jgi:hypothetical protein
LTYGGLKNFRIYRVPVYRYLLVCLLFLGIANLLHSEPVITVRFANPDYDFSTKTYCLDVEFHSDSADVQLFGINVRFWYADSVLEFMSMGEFQGGYGQVSPNPPYINTGNSSSGLAMFGFQGPAEYVNGAVQLVNTGNPVYISTTSWTKLFNICFHVDTLAAAYTDNFCPSLIWDLKQGPEYGSFLSGSEGVVITIVAQTSNQSLPSIENVQQFNWTYDNPPDPPYGYPLNITCISTRVSPTIKIDSTINPAGSYLTLPVRAWHFFDISSFSLTFDYNPAVLDYCCSVPDMGIATNFIDAELYAGRIRVISTGITADYPDGSILFNLTFKYYGESSVLSWYDDGTSCQTINAITSLPLLDLPSANFYINGNVSPGQYIWTGGVSANWIDNENWLNYLVPGRFNDVTINASPLPSNWPFYDGNFALGTNCRNMIMNGASQFTVTGDLRIDPGNVLTISGSGTLIVGGNWTNSGILNPGTGTVIFSSPTPGNIQSGVPPQNYCAGYIISTSSAGMTALSGGSPGPSGNDQHIDAGIGFTFRYLGVDYIEARINTNGWISLNLSGSDQDSDNNLQLYNTSAPTTVIAPWWDDLLADNSSSISFMTQGTSPERIFTVEWKNVLSYSQDATARLNFQVKLHESSNDIEFLYDNVSSGTHSVNEGASIGIKDAIGGPGNFIEPGSGTTNLMVGCLLSNLDWPAVNYKFSPPQESVSEVFYKMTVLPSTPLNIEKDVTITGK